MIEREKIEKILKQTNEKFAKFLLPETEVESKLFQKISLEKTEIKTEWLRLGRDIFKLKLYRFATSGLIALMIILLLGAGVSYAAKDTIPSDLLYPVKRETENLKLFLTQNFEKKNELKTKIMKERVKEWQKLKTLKSEDKNLDEEEKKLFKEVHESFKQNLKIIKDQESEYEKSHNFPVRKMEKLEKNINDLEKIHNLIEKELKEN